MGPPPIKQTSLHSSKLNVQGDIPKSRNTKQECIITSKVKLEPQGTVSPAPSKTPAEDIKNLLAFAWASWATQFLPTLYHCLRSADKPWELAGSKNGMVQTI
jgi:hypothetical protein